MTVKRVETEVVLTLGRVMGGDPLRSWRLRVADKRSGAEILTVKLDDATFSDMMSSTGAGRVGLAEVLVDDRVGKYAIYRFETIHLHGIDYKDREEWLTRTGRERAREMRVDEVGHDWQFAGYSGGGGGSQSRTMRYVRYSDTPLDEEGL